MFFTKDPLPHLVVHPWKTCIHGSKHQPTTINMPKPTTMHSQFLFLPRLWIGISNNLLLLQDPIPITLHLKVDMLSFYNLKISTLAISCKLINSSFRVWIYNSTLKLLYQSSNRTSAISITSSQSLFRWTNTMVNSQMED